MYFLWHNSIHGLSIELSILSISKYIFFKRYFPEKNPAVQKTELNRKLRKQENKNPIPVGLPSHSPLLIKEKIGFLSKPRKRTQQRRTKETKSRQLWQNEEKEHNKETWKKQNLNNFDKPFSLWYHSEYLIIERSSGFLSFHKLYHQVSNFM
jgi:hypothetical protein